MPSGNQSGQGAQVGSAAGTALGTALLPGIGGSLGGALGGIVGGAFGPEDETAQKAAEAQLQALVESQRIQLQGINTARADLAPFVSPGTASISGLLANILGQDAGNQFFDQQQAENVRLQSEKDANDAKRSQLQAELDDFKSRTSGGRRSKVKQAEMQKAINAIPEINVPFLGPRPTAQAQTTPQDVINNPFFQALAGEQDQRLLSSAAARGRVGAGGTNDALIRQQLLLGNQFQQQGIQNRQQELQNMLGLLSGGQNAAVGQANATTLGIPGLAGSAVAGGDVQAQNLFNQQAQANQRNDLLTSLLTGVSASLPAEGIIGSFGAQPDSRGFLQSPAPQRPSIFGGFQ